MTAPIPLRTRRRARTAWRAAGAALLTLAAACATRPDFDINRAQMDIAAAFDVPTRGVAIYEDGRGESQDLWVVDFKLDTFRPFLQARFAGRKADWVLQDARVRPESGQTAEWEPIGVVAGRIKRQAAEGAETTMQTMEELSGLVERYAVDHENLYPVVTARELEPLLVNGGYTETWQLGRDGWGHAIEYHASPNGQSYLIASPGADGSWDEPLETYFANTDEGLEAYGGASPDPDRDILFATGAFVQSYEPAS